MKDDLDGEGGFVRRYDEFCVFPYKAMMVVVVTTGLGLDVRRRHAHEVLKAAFFGVRVERVVRVYAH